EGSQRILWRLGARAPMPEEQRSRQRWKWGDRHGSTPIPYHARGSIGVVATVRAGFDGPAQVTSECLVLLLDACDGISEATLNVHPRSLGGRCDRSFAAAQTERLRERPLDLAQLRPQRLAAPEIIVGLGLVELAFEFADVGRILTARLVVQRLEPAPRVDVRPSPAEIEHVKLAPWLADE